MDVNISTGRKNQIRVQLGHQGYYIIGDDRYGDPSNPIKRLGLHAYELDFTNPLTHKAYKLNCPIPPSFKKLMASTGEEEIKTDKKQPKGYALGKNQAKKRKETNKVRSNGKRNKRK